MWRLLTTLLFLPLECLVSASCPPTNLRNVTGSSGELLLTVPCLNLTGKHLDNVTSKVKNQVRELDLSYNRIQILPQEFLKAAENLKSLFLHNNKLKSLPSLLNASKLKLLSLEKNQLVSIPTEDIPDCLETLRVDCTCGVTGSILPYCNRCMLSGIKCQCFSSEELMNATDYYSSNCHQVNSSLYAAIVVPILVLILLAILASFLIWRKRGATISHEKRASKTSEGTPGQPRYISHLPPPGNAFQDTGYHKDYENICHNNHEEKVSNHNRKRSPSKGKNIDGSQGDQPIYANYQGKPLQQAVDEEIYIIPD